MSAPTLLAGLYAAALAVVTVFGLNQFWLAWRYAQQSRARPGPVPRPDALPDGPAVLPSVTVQIPLYNEALVADRIIAACARLDYPRDLLQIQVLDDSSDDTVRIAGEAVRFWREQGVDMVHLCRTHRRGFKAGALDHGLRMASGELIAIFDADFVPPRDFLRRLVGRFSEPRTGFVQARWGHLNEDDNLLTRLQGFGLDGHFVVEQTARAGSGYPAGFNGTAGIWRRSCITDAGGWSADTLTEDLDLSYRAYMQGWNMDYVPELCVPAEVPVEMSGFRAQQHRWTKGAVQTTAKLAARLLRSPLGRPARLQGLLHLTAALAYPAMLTLALLHAPVSWMRKAGYGPGDGFFVLLGLGLVGFAGFFAGHLVSQRALHGDWARRLLRFPLFLAGSTGMCLSNSLAVAGTLVGRSTPFVRTPKFNASGGPVGEAWWRSSYASVRLDRVVWAEMGLAAVLTLGLAVLVVEEIWVSVPFQLVFAGGTWIVVTLAFRDAARARRARETARAPGSRFGM